MQTLPVYPLPAGTCYHDSDALDQHCALTPFLRHVPPARSERKSAPGEGPSPEARRHRPSSPDPHRQPHPQGREVRPRQRQGASGWIVSATERLMHVCAPGFLLQSCSVRAESALTPCQCLPWPVFVHSIQLRGCMAIPVVRVAQPHCLAYNLAPASLRCIAARRLSHACLYLLHRRPPRRSPLPS